MKSRKSISLFSGAMGLDLGLEQAGIRTAVAVEKNSIAVQTILMNKGGEFPVIDRPIEEVSVRDLLKLAGLRKGEAFVLVGGPCCQSFSTAGKRRSLGDVGRGTLFRHFKRIVAGTRPRFFVMENVKGMISAAVKHRPLNRRGPGHPPLARDEELGSALRRIRRELAGLGYRTIFGLVNCADIGVPQKRVRLIFIGSRDGEDISLPLLTHSEKGGKGKRPWVTLRRALADLKDPRPEFKPFSPKRTKLLKRLKAGQNWLDLPKRLHEQALGGAFHSWGGRCGFCRRLAWDGPAPTLTTDPRGRATTLCHPSKARPLSVREYARLQQFPADWSLAGETTGKYQQLGNAVPVGLGEAIGRALLKAAARTARGTPHRTKQKQNVVCVDESLAERIKTRRRTILNPPKFRRYKNQQTARNWIGRVAA